MQGNILFREGSSSSIPVGIVSLGEAAVDAVVEGGAVVLDDQPGAVAADGVHSEPVALVLPAVAVVQIVRSADRLRHWSRRVGEMRALEL